MGNPGFEQLLLEGATALQLGLPADLPGKLLRFRDELLKWNRKVNLTAVTGEQEVVEKHFLDSLAALPEMAGAKSLLDVGAGAGFPGIPLKLARPDLDVTVVDTVSKKVGFMKHALAFLGAANGGRALHVRVEGQPDAEGLGKYDRVIARAFTDVADWLPLAKHYVAEGGHVVAMLGRAPAREELDAQAEKNGMKVVSDRRFTLPFSKDPRAIVSFAIGS